MSSELLGRLQPALDKFVQERKLPGAVVMVARYVRVCLKERTIIAVR